MMLKLDRKINFLYEERALNEMAKADLEKIDVNGSPEENAKIYVASAKKRGLDPSKIVAGLSGTFRTDTKPFETKEKVDEFKKAVKEILKVRRFLQLGYKQDQVKSK